MNVNSLISTNNTLSGCDIRNACQELISFQEKATSKYTKFYESIQNNSVLCRKFLFINSIFNIALRKSSKFQEIEYLIELLKEFSAECNYYNPTALHEFENELWTYCILINTHTHDYRVLKAIAHTLTLPIQMIIDKMKGTESYVSLPQYLSGADSDISFTKPYRLFLNSIIDNKSEIELNHLRGLSTRKINNDVLLEELKQVRSLLVPSLPVQSMHYILKFYLAVAFNPFINIYGLKVNQYAKLCENVVRAFLNSNSSITEEMVLLVLDIQTAQKIIQLGSKTTIEGLPDEGQWNPNVDHNIFVCTIALIKGNKFHIHKNEAFLKLIDSCIQVTARDNTEWLSDLTDLVENGFTTDVKAQCYFLEALNHFDFKELERNLLFKRLVKSIGKSITNQEVIMRLYKMLEEYKSKDLLALLRVQVGPIINECIQKSFDSVNNFLISRVNALFAINMKRDLLVEKITNLLKNSVENTLLISRIIYLVTKTVSKERLIEKINDLLIVEINNLLVDKVNENLLIKNMKLKDLLSQSDKKLWRIINKKFLEFKMQAENLTVDEVSNILRNFHISTKKENLRLVLKQLKQFNDNSNRTKLQENNKLLRSVLHIHSFYFPHNPTSIIVGDYRKMMKNKYPILANIKTGYIFDGQSKILFIEDINKFNNPNLLRPGTEKFDFEGFKIIDLNHPQIKIPINTQTVKTFPQWVINLYSPNHLPNNIIIPKWFLNVALPNIFFGYGKLLANDSSNVIYYELISEFNSCVNEIKKENDEFLNVLNSILHGETSTISEKLIKLFRSISHILEVLRSVSASKKNKNVSKNIHNIVYKEFVNELFVKEVGQREINKNQTLNLGIETCKISSLYLMGIMAGMLSGVNGLGKDGNEIVFLRCLSGYIMQDLENTLIGADPNGNSRNIGVQLLTTDSCSNSIISPLFHLPHTQSIINEAAHEDFINVVELNN
jgi:hypothetical protein